VSNVATHSRDLLAALLGAAGPELTCEECFEQLDRYVELRLTAVDTARVAAGMRAHLAGCPACREDHTSLLELAGTDIRTGRGCR
jgi:hypothetical protein